MPRGKSAHALEIVKSSGYYPHHRYVPHCRCGWKGGQEITKARASRYYKLHSQYPKLNEYEAAKKMLETFVLGHSVGMKLNSVEWRDFLDIYISALRSMEKWKISCYYGGRGKVLQSVNINLVMTFTSDYNFTSWVRNKYGRDAAAKPLGSYWSGLQKKDSTSLYECTSFFLHIDKEVEKLKENYLEVSQWKVEFHKEMMQDSQKEVEKAKKLINPKKSTWGYLKERFPTSDAVRQAIEENDYSDSYTSLLERLIKYWEKRGK